MNTYEALTTRVTLSEFLDFEEIATVTRANKLAMDVWISKNPNLLEDA